MNEEQLKDLVRTGLATGGGLVGGYGVAKGWYTTGQMTAFLSDPTVITFAVSAVMMILGFLNRSKSNSVAIVNAMPEVKGVITAPTIAGKALSQSIPSDTVATAGTPAAASVAQK